MNVSVRERPVSWRNISRGTWWYERGVSVPRVSLRQHRQIFRKSRLSNSQWTLGFNAHSLEDRALVQYLPARV